MHVHVLVHGDRMIAWVRRLLVTNGKMRPFCYSGGLFAFGGLDRDRGGFGFGFCSRSNCGGRCGRDSSSPEHLGFERRWWVFRIRQVKLVDPIAPTHSIAVVAVTLPVHAHPARTVLLPNCANATARIAPILIAPIPVLRKENSRTYRQSLGARVKY